MKKLFTAFAFVLIASGAFAQFNQGRYLVGGSLGFSAVTHKSDNGTTTTTTGKSTSFSLSPDVGYFVIDNLAVGASLSLATSSYKSDGSSDKSNSSSVTIAPFVRYYLDPGIFFQGFVGGGSATNKDTYSTGQTTITTTTKTGILTWGLGAGYAYFLNDYVAIEPLVQYSSYARKNKDNDNRSINGGISLNVGFQIYLGPRN
jgi:hypothetical protein